MTRTKCQQLGCCYAESNGKPSCFHNTALAFIKYSGEKPGNGNGEFTQEHSTVDGCAYQCLTGEGESECKSFGIRRTGSDPEQGVSFQNCHLLAKTRNEYSDAREIRTDNNYDLYDFITFNRPATLYNAGESRLSDDSQRALEKMYTGCYLEKKDDPDLPYHVLTSGSDMTVEKCLATCRRQGFTFGGVQNGIECFCGNSVARKHGEATDCKEPCSGNWDQTCGGSSSNSVYHVPHDNRYLGCYQDNDEVHDLSENLWDEQSGYSAEDCIEQCALKDFKYAAVQKGGACYCGNTYGNYGGANETSCHLKCDGWGRQNCGGESQNAIYQSEAPFDLTSGAMTSTVVKAYDKSGSVTGISTRLFTLAPGLRSIITKKLVIHSSEEVETPYDDEACEQGCYTTCGELYQTEDFDEIGETIHIRFFHLRLSDLHRYTGKYAKTVYVYAQTVVIDEDIDVDYSLLIRTRQLIIDRKSSLTISVPATAPDLDVDVAASMYNGPEPDVLYLKQSFMCARILFESREHSNVNVAWKMVTDLAHYYGKRPEPMAYTASVRTFNARLAGIDRADLHYVPFYTKGHISQILATYHDKISLYKNDLDRLYDQSLSQSEFLDVAENLQKIYTDTDVAESKAAYDTSMDAVIVSNTTYYRMKEQYEVSVIKLEDARVAFEKGLKEYLAWAIVKAVFNFAVAVSKVVVGIIDFDVGDLYTSVDQTVGDAQAMVDSLQIISYSVYQTDSMSRMADDIFDRLAKSEGTHESLKYVDDLELTVAVQVDLIHWENLKVYAEIMMSDDMVSQIKGAAEYKAALMDTANWGSAMTRSIIEKSELLRQATQAKFLYESKLEQKERVDQVFVDARLGLADKEAMMAAIIEQTYDIRMDLNECLEMFCQAYFYENLYECKDAYKPKFGGELNDLLLQINAARRDDLLIGDAPSTASRILTIKDEDKDPLCNDAMTCPVNYFRNNRIFYYRLGTDHKDLADLDKYKVAEIILDFEGAQASETNTYLKIKIEASGEFQSKSRNQVYNFVSKPLSLAFEYDVISGHISLRADVYTPYRNIVNHITPFTTWTMRVADERSADIDVTKVSAIHLRLDGSAVNAVTLAQCTEEAPCIQQFDEE